MTHTPPTPHPEDAAAQLHAELCEIMRAEIGMHETYASPIAAAVLRGLRRLHGGREIYVPAECRSQRNAEIREAFDGTNADAVQRMFGISRSTLYRIVGERG